MYLWRDGSGHGCDGGVRGRLPREGGAQLQRVHGGELAQGLQAQAQLTQSVDKGKVTITCQNKNDNTHNLKENPSVMLDKGRIRS